MHSSRAETKWKSRFDAKYFAGKINVVDIHQNARSDLVAIVSGFVVSQPSPISQMDAQQ